MDDPASTSGAGSTADTSLPAVLAAADFSFDSQSFYPLAVVPAGDLDGDGFPETAQAGWNYATATTSVHIRYGGPRPRDAVEQLAFALDGARLAIADGDAISLTPFAAGDVDGDGLDDLLVKASECTNTEAGSGTYLIYGDAVRLAGTQSIGSVAARFLPPIFSADDSGDLCGPGSLAVGPGDLDGDGFDDIVITFGPQPLADGSSARGQGEGVYVYYGRAQRFAGEVPLSAADAAFRQQLTHPNAYPIGDVNGDGLADLFIGTDSAFEREDAFVLAGRAERYGGEIELAEVAALLPDLYTDPGERAAGPADIDGDGIDDLLVRDRDHTPRLFYGRPDLLDGAFDLAAADAVVARTEFTGLVLPAGDLDGDGDTELLDQFVFPPGSSPRSPREVALLSGSRSRLAGSFSFPEDEVVAATPRTRFPEGRSRVLTGVIPVGDLDGDGADDLFTFSELRELLGDGSYEVRSPQTHVHYGVKPALDATPR